MKGGLKIWNIKFFENIKKKRQQNIERIRSLNRVDDVNNISIWKESCMIRIVKGKVIKYSHYSYGKNLYLNHINSSYIYTQLCYMGVSTHCIYFLLECFLLSICTMLHELFLLIILKTFLMFLNQKKFLNVESIKTLYDY